ncbi:MAG TPA: Nramp family divalent metal transporter [Flavobacteriales bacterium]|nr:Nramp family divalent metal transporter [Flavobacteriales bacterium]
MSGTDNRSLSEVHGTVAIPVVKGWRRIVAFIGPAYLVSVGYMDPGNWATDIAGGSAFGYKLIWVLLMSNLMALLLQSLSARLGIVRGLDLAQASRHTYSPLVNIPLYILAEIAIAACDLAEVIGMAIGLHLLFDIPVLYGVLISALDTLLILLLMSKGMRVMEVFIVSIVTLIGLAFLTEMVIVRPEASSVLTGFVPSGLSDEALYIAIGIIGATVMPHNLYLHSSLVQTRRFERTPAGMREAIRFNFFDTTIALNIAFLVNAAILILAAAAFHVNGRFDVAEIDQAHLLLGELFGTLAPMLFAIALIGAGQSSTITGTLAGQIVMEGYLDLRIRPWLRRLITRLIAIVPAVVCIIWFGDHALGELLVLSQVILSLQLGFAVIPLIHYCSDKARMGEFTIGPWVQLLAWMSALIIVSLNARLVVEEIEGWLGAGGTPAFWVKVLVVPLVSAAGVLLLYIAIKPFFGRLRPAKTHIDAAVPELIVHTPKPPQRICITVEFSRFDIGTVNAALAQGGTTAEYLLIHVTESAAARYLGDLTGDREAVDDASNLEQYAERLRVAGYNARSVIGHGSAVTTISTIVNNSNADLLVMGAHGHRGLKDLLLGSTVDAVRHRVNVPVLVVK